MITAGGVPLDSLVTGQVFSLRWSPIHVRVILVWIALVFQAGVCSAQETSSHAVVIASGTETEATSSQYRSSSLVVGQNIVGSAQGGQYGIGFGFVNNQVVDASPPMLLSVADGLGGDLDESFDTSQLCFEWSALDLQSATYGAWLEIGTSPGAADILQTIVVTDGVACVPGPFPRCLTYYGTLRARNGAHLLSNILTTDGLFLDDPVDTDGDGLGNACDGDHDSDGILDENDPCPCDPLNDVDADGVCDGDGYCGTVIDNCPATANTNQLDSDMDGIGDVCQSRCVQVVSSTGSGDCSTIQECIATSGNCEIAVAAGIYDEQVVINRGVTLRAAGANGSAILTNSMSGATITVSSFGFDPVVLRGLQVTGIDTAIASIASWYGQDLEIRDVTIGIDLSNGGPGTPQVVIEDSSIHDTGTGIISTNIDLKVDRSVILQSSTNGLVASNGSVELKSSLIDFAAADCISFTGMQNAEVMGSTIVNCSLGIDAGSTTGLTISGSIFEGHNRDSIVLSCSDITYSNMQTSCCGGSNLCLPPQFENPALGDYSLSSGSPLIEKGTPANMFEGTPQFDLNHQPRLIDSNQDGLASAEMGAMESNTVSVNRPGEVQQLVFSSLDQIDWDFEPAAQFYRVYGGNLATLTYFTDPTCLAEQSMESYLFMPQPPPGQGLFFLVSSVNSTNIEGTVGYGTFAERSAVTSCP